MELEIKTRKWRRINPFICSVCHHRRMSLIYGRAKQGVCAKCRRNPPNPNQQTLV